MWYCYAFLRKTTHITQPLDVAVYRKMKIETAKLVNQAKMVKSDLWISKKQVSAISIFFLEKLYNGLTSCITEGFRKCGIFPFSPNAIHKSLLLRSSTDQMNNKCGCLNWHRFYPRNIHENLIFCENASAYLSIKLGSRKWCLGW